MTTSVNALTVPASAGASSSVNYAAILHGINDLRFEKAPALGDLKAGMVRIQIQANSICGSDVHMLKTVGLLGV